MIPIWPRYRFAFWLGFFLDLFKRSWEPATGGPFSFLILPFAAIVSGLVLLACFILGLPLRDNRVMRFWCSSTTPARFLVCLGVVLFMTGILWANHEFFNRHASADVADRILWAMTMPGFIAIIFSALYWPLPPRPQ
jgi:hypothetical protein